MILIESGKCTNITFTYLYVSKVEINLRKYISNFNFDNNKKTVQVHYRIKF